MQVVACQQNRARKTAVVADKQPTTLLDAGRRLGCIEIALIGVVDPFALPSQLTHIALASRGHRNQIADDAVGIDDDGSTVRYALVL